MKFFVIRIRTVVDSVTVEANSANIVESIVRYDFFYQQSKDPKYKKKRLRWDTKELETRGNGETLIIEPIFECKDNPKRACGCKVK